MLQFMILLHNVESTTDANLHKQGRSDCDHLWILPAMVLLFLLYGSVFPHCDNTAHLNCFFVRDHPMFFRTHRTDNVDPQPPFNTQLDSFASSKCYGNRCITTLSSPTLLVCLNTHLSRLVHPHLDLWCEHPGGCQ